MNAPPLPSPSSSPSNRLNEATSLHFMQKFLNFRFLSLSLMKFEKLLMQREEEDDQIKRLELEAEVAHLHEVLENEQKLNTVLCRVSHGSFCHSCLPSSSSISHQVQILIGDIAKVEEEIIYLERKVDEMKLTLHQERKYKRESQLQWEQRLQRLNHMRELEIHGGIEQSPNMEINNKIAINGRRASLELVEEAKSWHYKKAYENEAENTENFQQPYIIQGLRDEETIRGVPNKLSEQLIKILVSIFKKLIVPQPHIECEAATAPKLNISCIRSKGFMTKHLTGSSRSPATFQATQIQDPYSILPEGDIGPYKRFMQLTRSTLDLNRIVLCLPAIEKLRFLMHKLNAVELNFLSYKQRLAFWINIYNASIMNAFLQHGLPTSPGKLLELLNKAAFNVGGIVLNALAIEHFILQHSSDVKNGIIDEKEAQLRHTFGLGYPEPNITFALCRGTCSSPALRVYSAENVVKELEIAKVEFLEASICITSKKKMVIPKLLEWHMRNFADDIESLIEWIYSQLPRSTSLKRSVMDWLSADYRASLSKMVEIKPYNAEFRYLLSNY